VNILVLSSSERGGGAEQSAADLAQAYRRRGHRVRMVVGRRRGPPAADLTELPQHDGAAAALWQALEQQLSRRSFRGQARLLAALRLTAAPQRLLDWWRGCDLYRNAASFRLAEPQADFVPQAIHAHNLHGDWFDLRALPPLAERLPLIWTLHDGWALSGHCAYGVDCRRWQSGCGACPDLQRAPAIRRDGSAANWRARRTIAAAGQLALATPSHWLAAQVRASFWQHHPLRVIANGVDLALFQPGDRAAARQALGLPADAFIVLFNAAYAAGGNRYKDPTTVAAVLRQLQHRAPDINWLLLAVGHQPPLPGVERLQRAGYVSDRRQLVRLYQAADVLLHAAHAENHPLVVLEALACGLPVVATAVGGIAEQIDDGVHGFLAPRAAAGRLAGRLIELARQPALQAAQAAAALQRARREFALERQAAAYLDWFAELQAQRGPQEPTC
jgi:glycosyltransferase involved in cell wall biosynthesis